MTKTAKETKNNELTDTKISQWYKYDCEVFQTSIYLYIGTRTGLTSSMESFFRSSNMCDEFVEDVCSSICSIVSESGEFSNSGDCFTVTTEKFGTMHLIRLDKFSAGNVDDILVLNHECLHAAMKHLSILGIRESEDSAHECLCYFHENIFRNFLVNLHKQG